jgi:hypothetical protein
MRDNMLKIIAKIIAPGVLVSQLKFQLPGKGLLQKSFGFLDIAPPALCYYI